jgi:S-adenosylmethionine hydrolase
VDDGRVTNCVSFLTDYGLSDGFVAACHGVLRRLAPGLVIIDITHLVPPGDVRRGAAVLAQTVGYLPTGVHLAVVDPGVGTSRRGLAVTAPGGLLVGPDNGLLLAAAEVLGGARAAVELAVPVGTPATFHGRDVFAPAAAALANGRPAAALGVEVDTAGLVRLPAPVVRLGPTAIEAEVVLVDHFGNIQLAAPEGMLADAGLTPGRVARLTGPAGPAEPVRARVGVTFGSVPPGELVLYADAAGMAAIAVHGGDAAARLHLRPGDLVEIRPEM